MKNRRILIVEDQGILALDISNRLAGMDYDPLEIVSSGELAIVKADELRPDLILMDIQLSGELDGIDAAIRIKENQNVPIIYLTAHSDKMTLERAKQTIPYGYLVKPFQDGELHAALETAFFRFEMEMKTKESEEKFSFFMQSFNGIAYQMNLDHEPIFIKGSIESITGYTEEDFMALNPGWNQIIHPEDARAIMEKGVPFAKNDVGNHFTHEYRIIRKDGKIRWVQSSQQTLSNEYGKVNRIQGVIQDIHEKKQLEENLIHVQRLESLGVLAGGLAHDFNNLLTGLLGYINVARVNLEPEGTSYKNLVDAVAIVERATDLAQQLLVFSKGGEPVLETIKVDDLVKKFAPFALRGSKTNIVFDMAPDLWLVDFDRGQFSQVIQNLVLNASQAMPEGGTVSISCQKKISQIDGSDKKYVTIEITDKGIGIEASSINSIFDPYFTTKDNGSGLGLAITHTILIKHKASINVESQIGQGTTFRITIPATDSIVVEKTSPTKRSPTKSEGRLMIMDDEEAIRNTTQIILTQAGFNVDVAKDGTEAVEKYKKVFGTDKSYDLLILDLTIPGGMDGEKTLNEIQKINPTVKAIASSGYSNNSVLSDYHAFGFCSALPKPYSLEELINVVEDAISET